MSTTLSAAALAALQTAVVTGDRVQLTCGQLPRPVYEEVNEVLARLGGKWKGGRTSAHVFPWSPAEALAAVLETGERPPKNPDAFFATPPAIVTRLLVAAQLRGGFPAPPPGIRVLEPSAGTGAIADAVRVAVPWVELDVVELAPERAAVLRANGFRVYEGDFLQFAPVGVHYDRVLMNPPFAVAGDPLAYVTHVERAFALLRPGGLLAAIAPAGFTFRVDRRSSAFRALVEAHGGWELLPVGSFKESGTEVSTALVVMRRPGGGAS